MKLQYFLIKLKHFFKPRLFIYDVPVVQKYSVQHFAETTACFNSVRLKRTIFGRLKYVILRKLQHFSFGRLKWVGLGRLKCVIFRRLIYLIFGVLQFLGNWNGSCSGDRNMPFSKDWNVSFSGDWNMSFLEYTILQFSVDWNLSFREIKHAIFGRLKCSFFGGLNMSFSENSIVKVSGNEISFSRKIEMFRFRIFHFLR